MRQKRKRLFGKAYPEEVVITFFSYLSLGRLLEPGAGWSTSVSL